MSSHMLLRPAPRANVLEIDAYVPGKSGGPGAGKVFKLSSNETPLGPSARAVEAFRANADQLALYPDGAARRLREAIGGRYGLDPARIICGNGSDDILSLIGHAYLGPGDEGLYSQYGFLEYPIAIRAAGAAPIVAPETNFTASVDNLLSKITDRTKLYFWPIRIIQPE